jgi:ATP-dependent DNA helicase 2 subunit 1
MPQDLKKAQTYGGKRICFENDEVTEIKRFEDPGTMIVMIIHNLFIWIF